MRDEEIERLFDQGNHAARGYSAGSNAHGTLVEAAEAEGLTHIRVLDSANVCGARVAGIDQQGDLIAICDSGGPWAVNITIEVEESVHG